MLPIQNLSTILHKFKATDADMPNSTDFLFSVFPSRVFSIDAQSGEMRLEETLDRETRSEYKLNVSVKDPEIGGKRLATSLTCTVTVLDVNDNKPVFDKTRTDFKILPVIGERTLLGFFSVSDADLGNNATIDYFLLNDYDRLFELDQVGHVYLNLRGSGNK